MTKLLGRSTRYLMLCFVLTAHRSPAVAQTNAKDSLCKLLARHDANDTVKIKLLAALASKYYYSNADSQYILGRQLMALSEKARYIPGKMLAFEAIGSSRFQAGKYDSAIFYAQQGLVLCREYHWPAQQSNFYNNIANAYFRLSRHARSLEYYDSALSVHPGKEMEAKVHSNIANVYYVNGSYLKALNYYLEGLRVQEQLGALPSIASDLSNISNVYFRLGDFPKALEYNRRGMALNQQAGAKISIIGNLTTYALIYDAEKKYDSSLLRLNEALLIANELSDVFTQNLLKSNIAECYLKKGEYDKALPLYTESVTVSEKLGDEEGAAIAKAGVGEVMLRRGKSKEGISFMQAALAMMQGNNMREQGMAVARKLSNAFQNNGDYKQALHYFEIADEFEDSLAINKSRKQAEQVIFTYELQKKEDQISLLHKDNAIRRSENKRQRTSLLASLIGLLLATIIAYLLFRNARNARKSTAMISKQKSEMERLAAHLQELNDFKDTTFSILSHDLRSPVNALTSTLMMLDERMITPEEFAQHKLELNNKLQSVSLLLDNLLYWSRSQMKGEQILDREKLPIKRKALRTMAILKDAAAQKTIELINRVPENIYAYADNHHVEIALRNLVSNAIKFTPAGGSVTINATTEGKFTRVSVTDTGIGITGEQAAKLFSGDANISTFGTMGEKGTGLGLRLSYDFIKRNGGDIIVSSEPLKGSVFTIILPAAEVQ